MYNNNLQSLPPETTSRACAPTASKACTARPPSASSRPACTGSAGTTPRYGGAQPSIHQSPHNKIITRHNIHTFLFRYYNVVDIVEVVNAAYEVSYSKHRVTASSLMCNSVQILKKKVPFAILLKGGKPADNWSLAQQTRSRQLSVYRS